MNGRSVRRKREWMSFKIFLTKNGDWVEVGCEQLLKFRGEAKFPFSLKNHLFPKFLSFFFLKSLNFPPHEEPEVRMASIPLPPDLPSTHHWVKGTTGEDQNQL